jgi:hypothetical protein
MSMKTQRKTATPAAPRTQTAKPRAPAQASEAAKGWQPGASKKKKGSVETALKKFVEAEVKLGRALKEAGPKIEKAYGQVFEVMGKLEAAAERHHAKALARAAKYNSNK